MIWYRLRTLQFRRLLSAQGLEDYFIQLAAEASQGEPRFSLNWTGQVRVSHRVSGTLSTESDPVLFPPRRGTTAGGGKIMAGRRN
jgi:hypothetical protein